MSQIEGKVVQVVGPVLDISFEEGHVPEILNAIHVTSEGFDTPVPISLTAEVAQHLGEGVVKCVSMEPTDGVVRGMKAVDTGAPISVPVGRGTLGRIMNVLGQPVDQQGPVEAEKT